MYHEVKRCIINHIQNLIIAKLPTCASPPSPLPYLQFQNCRVLTSVGSLLHGSQQRGEDRVKCDGEGAVNDAAVHVCPEVQFTDVAIL